MEGSVVMFIVLFVVILTLFHLDLDFVTIWSLFHHYFIMSLALFGHDVVIILSLVCHFVLRATGGPKNHQT